MFQDLNKRRWWFRIPYYYACFAAIVGWLLVYIGQHRMVMGPESWGYFSGGNIVVLGNWMTFIGCAVVFLYTVINFMTALSVPKFIFQIAVAVEMLVLFQEAVNRFEAWGILKGLYSFDLLLLGIFAFFVRLCFTKYRKYT